MWRAQFTPDGTVALTAAADGRVRRWHLATLEADAAALRIDAANRFGLAPGDGLIVELP